MPIGNDFNISNIAQPVRSPLLIFTQTFSLAVFIFVVSLIPLFLTLKITRHISIKSRIVLGIVQGFMFVVFLTIELFLVFRFHILEHIGSVLQ